MTNRVKSEPIPVGLYHLSYYLPPKQASIEELADSMGLSEEELRLYRDVHGLRAVRLAEGETGSDMALKAAALVLEESRIDPESVDAVIMYYTAFTASLEPNSIVGRIQHELKLTRSVGFSVWEQYCASIITAFQVAQSMIRTGAARIVMLVGADCFFGSTRRAIDRITIQGEGSSALLVKGGCTDNRLVGLTTYVDGSFYRTSRCSRDDLERFDLVYFLATVRTIQRTLRKADLTLDEIALIIPHNINLSSWERVMTMLKCDRSRLFAENIPRYGHIFGSDLAINLRDAISSGRLRRGEYALLVTAGLGASWGCAIVQH
jgi:3-oxoacyl-[acyl-carrier-protein] synthase III